MAVLVLEQDRPLRISGQKNSPHLNLVADLKTANHIIIGQSDLLAGMAWDTLLFSSQSRPIRDKSVFEITGRFYYHGQHKAQRLSYVILRHATFDFFWVSRFLYTIS